MIPKYKLNSLKFKSNGIFLKIFIDKPNITFIQLLKKKVGVSKYKIGINKKVINGKRSNKNEKNKTSAIKKIEPGNPKNTKQFAKLIKNNFGVKKFIPLISVINRVLNLLFIASTKRNAFDDKNA